MVVFNHNHGDLWLRVLDGPSRYRVFSMNKHAPQDAETTALDADLARVDVVFAQLLSDLQQAKSAAANAANQNELRRFKLQREVGRLRENLTQFLEELNDIPKTDAPASTNDPDPANNR